MCHSRAGGNPLQTLAGVQNGFPPARE